MGQLDKQDGAAADWQAAGSWGADCDPKDVARMVEDYVIEKKEEKKKKKGGRLNTANPHVHHLTPLS